MIFLALILPGVGYGPAIDLKGVGPKSAVPRLRVLSLFEPKNLSCVPLKPFDSALRATLRANGLLTNG